jgi:hypothetical protein
MKNQRYIGVSEMPNLLRGDIRDDLTAYIRTLEEFVEEVPVNDLPEELQQALRARLPSVSTLHFSLKTIAAGIENPARDIWVLERVSHYPG